MKIDFSIPTRRRGKYQPQATPTKLREPRPGRAAVLLALAHRFDALVQSGVVKDYVELARLGHVSRARITQIMNLLDLAPAIQEVLLGVAAGTTTSRITERDLRRIVREVRWDHQVWLFEQTNSSSRARRDARL